MLGWNHRVLQIAREIDAYMTPGSGLTLVADDPAAAAALETLRAGLHNQALRFVPQSPTSRDVLDALDVASYHHVLVVSPTTGSTRQRADARTLVTLLHLRDIASKVGHPFSITSRDGRHPEPLARGGHPGRRLHRLRPAHQPAPHPGGGEQAA